MGELFAVFGVNWKLLLVQVVNFGLLLSVLTYLLYKPILKVIDERQRKIAEGVKTAEAADAKLASAHTEGGELIAKAARDAEGMVAEARTRAGEKESDILKNAETRAALIIADAAARAEEAKRQALAANEQEIAKTALLVAEKILKQKSA